jgi:hypothetical protein
MKPIIRFNSIVISLTTIAVFGIWYGISRLVLAYPDWFKDPNTNKYNLIGLLLTGIISIGFYRTFFIITSSVVNNCRKIKKLIFSSYYLEGTWIGFYIGVSGNVRYLIETYEQDLDGTVIRGKSFNEVENFHSTWVADTINIDIKKGKISYQYKVESPIDTSDHNGIAFFNFERDRINKAPEIMIGFSADLHLTEKCKAIEYRISENTNFDLTEAIVKAKEFYQNKKDHFFKQ